jgi:Lrp/AsnC family transcriptional regulator of ectoine degradation
MARTRAVDRLDIKIMAALERNGRMTKAELSDVVGLSVTPCSARIAKLEAAGFIKGYHADIDLERICDLSQFTVVVSIQQWTPERARQFEELVAGIAQIIECDAVFGSVDFVMRVYATDADHCREVMEPLDRTRHHHISDLADGTGALRCSDDSARRQRNMTRRRAPPLACLVGPLSIARNAGGKGKLLLWPSNSAAIPVRFILAAVRQERVPSRASRTLNSKLSC